MFHRVENTIGIGKYLDRDLNESANYEINLSKLGLKGNKNEMRPSEVERER